MIDTSSLPYTEWQIRDHDPGTCAKFRRFVNESDQMLIVTPLVYTPANAADQDILQSIYKYHFGFNATCPQPDEDDEVSSNQIETQYKDALRKIDNLIADKKKLQSAITDKTAALQKANQKISELSQQSVCPPTAAPTQDPEIPHLQNTIQSLQKSLGDLRSELKTAETSTHSFSSRYHEAKQTITNLNAELNSIRNQYNLISNEKVTADLTIKGKDNEIASLHDQLEEYKKQIDRLTMASDGAQNKALTLKSSHSATVQQLKQSFELRLTDKINTLTKSRDDKLASAIQLEEEKCKSQRDRDLLEWKIEADNIKQDYKKKSDDEIAIMRATFTDEIVDLRQTIGNIRSNDDVKSEPMETDEYDRLFSKIDNNPNKF